MSKTKYPGIYRDKKGTLFIQTTFGTDRITGKPIRKKTRSDQNGVPFVTLKDAHQELVRLQNNYRLNNGIANHNILFSDFMTIYYIPQYKAKIENSTWESRKHGLQALSDRFAKKKLGDLKSSDCLNFSTWLLADSGYSKGYASLLYGQLRQVLELAVNLNYLNVNVAKQIPPIPKGRSSTLFWTKKDFETVISKICIDNYYEHFCFILIWIYFMTGMRVSEALALSWDDIDLNEQKINVHQTLEMKNQHNYVIKPYGKTFSSTRIIYIDKDTCGLLKKWKNRQQLNKVKKFVLSCNNRPIYKSTVNRIIKRYAEIAGVPLITGKGLRHSHASYLVNEFNANVVLVSQRLGHSSPDITLKVYSHLWKETDKAIADMMNNNIHVSTSASTTTKTFNGNQAFMMSNTI